MDVTAQCMYNLIELVHGHVFFIEEVSFIQEISVCFFSFFVDPNLDQVGNVLTILCIRLVASLTRELVNLPYSRSHTRSAYK